MRKPIYWVLGVGILLAIVWVVSRDRQSARSEDVTQTVPAASAERDPASTSAEPVDRAQPIANKEAATESSPKPLTTVMEGHKIDVAPGFELLSEGANTMKDTDLRRPMVRRHEKLQDEPRDEAWAGLMEAALRNGIQDSLTAKGLDTQRVELPVIECRTTGCEIQALAYPEDNGKDGIDLQRILPTLIFGPLKQEFDGFPSMFLTSRSDGRDIVIAHLARKQK